VMKPSEVSAATSAVLARLVPQYMDTTVRGWEGREAAENEITAAFARYVPNH